jgi:hypothetical protein
MPIKASVGAHSTFGFQPQLSYNFLTLFFLEEREVGGVLMGLEYLPKLKNQFRQLV